ELWRHETFLIFLSAEPAFTAAKRWKRSVTRSRLSSGPTTNCRFSQRCEARCSPSTIHNCWLIVRGLGRSIRFLSFPKICRSNSKRSLTLCTSCADCIVDGTAVRSPTRLVVCSLQPGLTPRSRYGRQANKHWETFLV